MTDVYVNLQTLICIYLCVNLKIPFLLWLQQLMRTKNLHFYCQSVYLSQHLWMLKERRFCLTIILNFFLSQGSKDNTLVFTTWCMAIHVWVLLCSENYSKTEITLENLFSVISNKFTVIFDIQVKFQRFCEKTQIAVFSHFTYIVERLQL